MILHGSLHPHPPILLCTHIHPLLPVPILDDLGITKQGDGPIDVHWAGSSVSKVFEFPPDFGRRGRGRGRGGRGAGGRGCTGIRELASNMTSNLYQQQRRQWTMHHEVWVVLDSLRPVFVVVDPMGVVG